MDDKKEWIEIELSEIKAIELQVVKIIRDYCDLNDIKYFLMYGTLLGAIRHKGFIPWDDDIDIGMPRNDYEKFIASFHAEGVSLYNVGDKEYSYPFCKVSANNTRIEEKDTVFKTPFGIYVDIFPIDNIPKEDKKRKKFFKKLSFLKLLLSVKSTRALKKKSFFRNVKVSLGKVLLLPISTRRLCRSINKFASQYKDLPISYMGNSVWGYGEKETTAVEVFDESESAIFEGESFSIPRQYDVWLTNIYGDYMMLPPVEEQVTHHNMRAWKLKKL